jgi:NAD(P)-dependent dehydrogenase (short-subunit alcohol dehydrogenase family)
MLFSHKTDFQDKVAVVTGAGSGIGRALALGLAKRGARLALSDINAAGLAETENLLRQTGAEVDICPLDVADKTAITPYATRVQDRFGAVHQLYNNAGTTLGSREFLEMADTHIETILQVNLMGVLWTSKAFLPHLIASGDGALVNISSLNGVMAQQGLSAYCASKFAVRGLTDTLRVEMQEAGHPVRVTVVHPGGVATNIANAAIPEDASLSDDERREAKRRAELYNARLLRMPAERAADRILNGVRRGKGRILITKEAYVTDLMVRCLPASYPGILARYGSRLLGL